MSDSGWGNYVAAGLIALLFLYLLPNIASWISGADFFRCQDTQQYRADGTKKTKIGFELRPRLATTDFKEPDCQSPENNNQADLCQQRRMADAAAQATCFTEWQSTIAACGLILILGTIYYARSAAIHARNAAVSAGRQANAALDAVKIQRLENRAWLRIEDVQPDGEWALVIGDGGAHISVRIKFTNVGKTVARQVIPLVTFACINSTEELKSTILRIRAHAATSEDDKGKLIAFPDTPVNVWRLLAIPKSKIDAAVQARSESASAVTAFIIVNVVYKIDGGTERHETGLPYLVRGVDLATGHLPAGPLVIEPWAEFDGWAT